ncbi:MAG: T9SS type A sorting domain-containing protein, partial [Saprospiraceae bacterium]
YINIELNSKSQTDIEIYDLTGRIVLSESFFASKWKVHFNETPGLYLVRLKIDNKAYTRKIQLK